jgi:hypothetical protein
MADNVNQYAVKVINGSVSVDIKNKQIGPGIYYTSVNIHNPGQKEALFYVKIALSGLNGAGGLITKWKKFTLKYDEATEFDLAGFITLFIASGIPIPIFIEGYFVIECITELDVVGVYTGSAVQDQHLGAMHLERVPTRKVTSQNF